MEGVSWMNYFLVIFIALPLVLLMMVKVNIKTRTDSEEKAILVVKEAFSSLSVRALPVPETKI